MGADAPAEHIIASIVAVVLSLSAPLVTPFSRRFPQHVRMNVITILNITIVAVVAAFALRSPFDERHQRRLFVLGSDNVSPLRGVWQSFGLMVSIHPVDNLS